MVMQLHSFSFFAIIIFRFSQYSCLIPVFLTMCSISQRIKTITKTDGNFYSLEKLSCGFIGLRYIVNIRTRQKKRTILQTAESNFKTFELNIDIFFIQLSRFYLELLQLSIYSDHKYRVFCTTGLNYCISLFQYFSS